MFDPSFYGTIFSHEWKTALDVQPQHVMVSPPIGAAVNVRPVSPTAARYATTTFPHAELLLYSGTGHSPFFETPERFAHELAAFARRVLA